MLSLPIDFADSTLPGGHYWNEEKVEADPWVNVVYSEGVHRHGHVAAGHAEADLGYDYAQSVGHVLVVHNRAGARVTCAVIPGAKQA